MILKVFLSIIFVICLGLIGFLLGQKHKVQQEIFEELVKFNKLFLCDIVIYKSTVLYNLEHCSEVLKALFQGADESLKNGKPFVCKDSRLNKTQQKIVSDYVNLLGVYDEKNQENCLGSFEKILNDEKENQKNLFNKNGKIYSKLGISFAIVVVILLF